MQVVVSNNIGFAWFAEGNVRVKGYFHVDGVGYAGHSAAKYFSGTSSWDDFNSKIAKLNGVFAVIISEDNRIFAAVDRLRSIPLFYSVGPKFVISDDGYIISDYLQDSALDDSSIDEFLLSGNVVGNRTLLKSMKQIEAGQSFKCESGIHQTKFYFRHLHQDFFSKPESEYIDDLNVISRNVFNRLIESCEGRTIVVPLSGGYDSRFIVTMLRKLGATDVICFSYGRRQSFEAKIAKKVAERLGYDWHFVEYTDDHWQACPREAAFVRYASNLASAPHFQDVPALKALKNLHVIPDDAVFVPGYCGDLLAGSYVPYEILVGKPDRLEKEGLYQYIFRRHFWYENQCNSAEGIVQRIVEDSPFPDSSGDASEFVSGNEEFFTRNRVAKFVVNAVRSIEYFDYEWRLPLWDNELVDYFYRVPLSQRLDDRLYDRFLLREVFRPYDIDYRKRGENAIKRAFKVYCPNSIYRIAETLYRSASRKISHKKKTDVNASSVLAEVLAEEVGLENGAEGRSSPSLVAQWYIEKYLPFYVDGE